MKKVIVLFMFVIFTSSSAWAHPPSKIDLTYDSQEGMLHIVIYHTTNNLTKHYIRKISIVKDKTQPQEIFVNKQSSPKEHVEDVPIELKQGDEVVVKANCNIGGSKSATLVLEPEQEGDQDKKE